MSQVTNEIKTKFETIFGKTREYEGGFLSQDGVCGLFQTVPKKCEATHYKDGAALETDAKGNLTVTALNVRDDYQISFNAKLVRKAIRVLGGKRRALIRFPVFQQYPLVLTNGTANVLIAPIINPNQYEG